MLSKEKIILSGLDILNKGEDLSMRKLAEYLDIKASSIYWYFKSKQEVLDGIAIYLSDKVEVSDNLHGKDFLKTFCIKEYEVLSENINTVMYFSRHQPSSSIGIQVAKKVVTKVMEMGYTVYDSLSILEMLHQYVFYNVKNSSFNPQDFAYTNKIIYEINPELILSREQFEAKYTGDLVFVKYLDILINSIYKK